MGHILAIDVGATNTRVAEVDSTGRILTKESARTEKDKDEFVASILELITKAKLNLANIDGVGFCIAGLINQKEGMLMSSPNLAFKNFEIVKPLEKYLGKKIVFVNDANAAAMGEKVWGDGKRETYFVYLTFSSGIGGAAVVDNDLCTQDNGNGIEPGHLEMNFGYELPCGCGGIDHWESYASGINMPKFLAAWADRNCYELDFDGKDVYKIFQAINEGNETALKFFEQVINIDIKGINILVNKYHAQTIFIGGSVYLKNVDIFNKFLIPRMPEDVKLKVATFGDDASLIGAASFFLQKTALLS